MDEATMVQELLEQEIRETNSDPVVQALDILALGITARNLLLRRATGETHAWTLAERKAYERAVFALRGVGAVVPA